MPSPRRGKVTCRVRLGQAARRGLATGTVTGGVDTHGESHRAVVLDQVGRELGDQGFPNTPSGYRSLLGWVAGHGQLDRVGVEGTEVYGAALARHMRAGGVTGPVLCTRP